jgi:hypothetical protein
VVKHLPSKCEALRSKPTTATKKKNLKFEASLCNSQKKKKRQHPRDTWVVQHYRY